MVLRVQFMKLNSSYDPCITYCIKFYNNLRRNQLARLACFKLMRSWSGGFPNVSLCLTFFTFLGHLGLQVIHLYLHLPHHAVVLLALHPVHDDDDDDGQDQDPAPHADHDDVLQGQGQLRLLILQEAHKERQVFTDGHLW